MSPQLLQLVPGGVGTHLYLAEVGTQPCLGTMCNVGEDEFKAGGVRIPNSPFAVVSFLGGEDISRCQKFQLSSSLEVAPFRVRDKWEEFALITLWSPEALEEFIFKVGVAPKTG